MNSRYEQLDSLRGLAALSVFGGHMYLIFNETLLSKVLFEYGPLRATVAGSEAVTLFFVLSGFVLSLPFYRDSDVNYRGYLIKRICRIYIPYITAIMVSFIFRQSFYSGNINGLSNWFNVSWSTSLNINTAIDHLLLVGTFTSNLNNVVWSLVHEMRISIVFPLIMALIVRLNYKKSIILGIGLSVISVIFSFLSGAQFLGTEIYVTLHYCMIFIIGALIAKYRENLIKRTSDLNIKSKIMLFLIGTILYLYAHPSFLLNILINGFNPFYRTVIDTFFTSIGAGILIVFAISSIRFSTMLKNKLINYIGKISYSLYLSHLAVLFLCIHLIKGLVPIGVILLIAIIATFIVSSLMYFFIEKPAIKLGKYLARENLKIKGDQTNNASTVKIS